MIFNSQAVRRVGEPRATGPATGFMENMGALFSSDQATELLVSEGMMVNEALDERRAKIEELTGQDYDEAIAPFMEPGVYSAEGKIGTLSANPSTDDKAVAALRASLPEDQQGQVLTDEQVRVRAQELALERVIAAEDVAARAQGAGAIAGQFIGSVGAQFTDPLVLGTLAIGPASGARLAVAAAINGVVAGGVTAAQQPAVQAWRERLGLPAGIEEAARNIGLATVGGAGITAVLGGVVKGLGYGVARLTRREQVQAFDELVPDPTPEQIVARDQIDAEARFEETNPFKPQRLVVARRLDDGTIEYGQPGQIHSDLGDSGEMGFAVPDGPFLTRNEADAFMRASDKSTTDLYDDVTRSSSAKSGVLLAEPYNLARFGAEDDIKAAAQADAEHYSRAARVADAMDRDEPLPRFDDEPAPEPLIDRTPDYEAFADPVAPAVRSEIDLLVQGYRTQIEEAGDFNVVLDEAQGPVSASRMLEDFDAEDAFLREIETCR